MNKLFRYSLLQYRHSQEFDEVLNIGVLVFFEHAHRAIFKYSKRIDYLKYIYPSFEPRHIMSYLKGFTAYANDLSNDATIDFEKEISNDTAAFIHQNLLPEDATALQFSKIYTSVLYSENLNQVVENLLLDYGLNMPYIIDELRVLKVADHISVYERRLPHDEKYLLQEVNKLLSEQRDLQVKKALRRNFKLTAKNASLVFDLAWQNGSQNLVKSISFDLQKADSIQRKADRFFGALYFLSDEAEENNYRFDLLVAKPQKKGLLKAYDKAIEKLRQVPAKPKIVEEEELEQYAMTIRKNLLSSGG